MEPKVYPIYGFAYNMGVIMKALNQLPEKNLIDKKYVSQYLNTLLK